MSEIKMLFEKRVVTKKGTYYSRMIGDSEHIPKEALSIIDGQFKSLIGKSIEVNGKLVNVLDYKIEKFCNLVNYMYHITILTDEEYET